MATKAQMLDLTRLEREILCHRLSTPDCIVDALGCELDNMDTWHPEDVLLIVELLLDGMGSRGVSVENAMHHSDSITPAVLRDAVEGSTYMAAGSYDPRPTRQKDSAASRACESLAKKIGEFIGAERPLVIPLA